MENYEAMQKIKGTTINEIIQEQKDEFFGKNIRACHTWHNAARLILEAMYCDERVPQVYKTAILDAETIQRNTNKQRYQLNKEKKSKEKEQELQQYVNVLKILPKEDTFTTKEFAIACNKSVQKMTAVLKQLTERGIVEIVSKENKSPKTYKFIGGQPNESEKEEI